MAVILSCAWGALYILCAALGFLVSPSGLLKAALVLFSIVFFVPGALLLTEGFKKGNRRLVLAIRWICIISLLLTTVLVLVFFACAALASEAVVNGVFVALTLLSAPMISSQYWILSIFLWACLLSATFLKKLPK